MNIISKFAIVAGAGLTLAACNGPTNDSRVDIDDIDEIGRVTSAEQLIGRDHEIRIAAFDDPEIDGISCYLSRAVTGGISGSLGLAEDTSDASISCRQVGPIALRAGTDISDIDLSNNGETIFGEDRSILFKGLYVQRHYDAERNVVTYLTYSRELIDGSPKNSISVVPLNNEINLADLDRRARQLQLNP